MAKRKRYTSHQKPQQLPVELDIVIPVYGRPDLLQKCLSALALAAFDVNYRLFVVDDASPDQTQMDAIYSTLNGTSKVVKNRQNSGFPATANRGAAMGKAKSILFLNSDVEIKGGAIRKMLNALWATNSPEGMLDPAPDAPVGVVAPKLIFPDGYDQSRPAGKVQHAGMAFNTMGKPIHVNIGWSVDHPKVNIARSMQCVSGACLMARRETWNAVTKSYKETGDPTLGGFNEIYGMGTFEDIELCLAARSHGYKVVYEPAAVGTHHVGASSDMQGKEYPMQRNESIFRARCGHLVVWDEWLYW